MGVALVDAVSSAPHTGGLWSAPVFHHVTMTRKRESSSGRDHGSTLLTSLAYGLQSEFLLSVSQPAYSF